MGNEIDLLLDEAREEWDRDGVLSTTTYIELNNLGVDADAVIADLDGLTPGAAMIAVMPADLGRRDRPARTKGALIPTGLEG